MQDGSQVVAAARCRDYEAARVEGAVSAALAALGGIGRFVKNGQRVVIKVNLLRASGPDEAIITHPAVVRAVVRQVQSAGAQAIIADTPFGRVNGGILHRLYRESGLAAVAAETGALLNDDLDTVRVSGPDDGLVKMFEILRVVAEADAVITVPKLKTHNWTQFTGATKILFGVIPGVAKVGYHARFVTVDRFAEMLVDLLETVRPRLSVMDAVVAMEGQGPSGGKPRHGGFLLASANGYAMDVVATNAIGLPAERVPMLKVAARRGLVSLDPQHTTLSGATLDELRMPGFKLAGASLSMGSLPPFLRTRFISQVSLSPVVQRGGCTGCRTCHDNCPVQAISMIEGKARIDLSKCIRCYCCHEGCPENTIDLRAGRIASLLKRVT